MHSSDLRSGMRIGAARVPLAELPSASQPPCLDAYTALHPAAKRGNPVYEESSDDDLPADLAHVSRQSNPMFDDLNDTYQAGHAALLSQPVFAVNRRLTLSPLATSVCRELTPPPAATRKALLFCKSPATAGSLTPCSSRSPTSYGMQGFHLALASGHVSGITIPGVTLTAFPTLGQPSFTVVDPIVTGLTVPGVTMTSSPVLTSTPILSLVPTLSQPAAAAVHLSSQSLSPAPGSPNAHADPPQQAHTTSADSSNSLGSMSSSRLGNSAAEASDSSGTAAAAAPAVSRGLFTEDSAFEKLWEGQENMPPEQKAAGHTSLSQRIAKLTGCLGGMSGQATTSTPLSSPNQRVPSPNAKVLSPRSSGPSPRQAFKASQVTSNTAGRPLGNSMSAAMRA